MQTTFNASRATIAPPRLQRRQRVAGGALGWMVVAIGALLTAGGAAVVVIRLGPELSFAAMTVEAGPPSPAKSPDLAILLLRSTLFALNDANRTGNYSVLRDLAAPGFQAANSAADLADIFQGMRAAGVDLSAAAALEPDWVAPPQIETDAVLRLKGHFATNRGGVRFALGFADIDGVWRLIEIGITGGAHKP